jgi:ribonuclease Z
MTQISAGGEMEVVFLGTGSATPSSTRNHSCIAFRLDSSVWLFDVGEGSQHQLLKCPQVKLGKIERIFLTHLHGDHAFGLPGLMCTMLNSLGGGGGREAENQQEQRPPLQIYGPVGSRRYVRQALFNTYSHLSVQYQVHELLETRTTETTGIGRLVEELHSAEVVGEDLVLDEASETWKLFENDRCVVVAAPLSHTVPTVGFVVTEKSSPGKLNIGLAKPILERNKDVLASALGVKNPLTLLSKVKDGQAISLPDGTVILRPEDVVGPPRPGRKVVILGDTSNSDKIVNSAKGADLLIHEATNAKLQEDTKTEEEVEETTKQHGHSTPQMAGDFAKRCEAKRLVLTHFSQRYKGDNSPESLAVMEEIRLLAVSKTGGTETQVLTAFDLLSLNIPRKN